MKTAMMKPSWAEHELGQAELVDKRLVKRMIKIATDFYQQPQAAIPKASGSAAQAKAAYRFFDNDDVHLKEMLTPHRERTLERCEGQKTVLMINDTSYLEFTGHPETKDLGVLSAKHSLGLLIHPTLATTWNGTPLGLVDLQAWRRSPEEFGKSYHLKERLAQEKESQKWLNSYRAAVKVQFEHPNLNLIFISDREADLFDLFALADSPQARCDATGKRPELLIRVAQNRCLVPNAATALEEETDKHLWQTLAVQPVAGHYTVKVPRKNKRKPRHAEVAIRFAQVTLATPKGRPKHDRQTVTLWAVWAKEENPPVGVEAIAWMLLTTIPVTTLEQAIETIKLYTRRWSIELLFKVLKSGCRFEDRQLGTADRLKRCLVIDLIVAWRILYMTKVARALPALPCTALFEEEEWQALWCFVNRTTTLPKQVPTLQSVVRMVAKLGGFLDRKSDGEPGIKSLWLGLHRLNDIVATWQLFNQPTKKSRKSCG